MSANGVREPCVAAQFYPSDKRALKDEIKRCFLSGFGPGSLPSKAKSKDIVGVVAPHAGYQFSGPCAAFSYKEIAESKAADTFVMLGLSHMGFPSCVSLSDWKTPLGTVKNDAEFGELLMEKGISHDEGAHSEEHSIEVQLPFLQFVADKPRIVPVIAGHDIAPRKIGEAIIRAAIELKRKVVVIASSDFTHYGPAYGYVPFSKNARENMYVLDRGAIERILALDSEGFISYINKNAATICGQMPIACLIWAAAAKKARLLKYYTSGDVVGDYTNAVGYASIALE